MRARYYSPELRRFVNADIVAGSLDNAITLNRFAYANGNPVSLVDPFGLTAERSIGGGLTDLWETEYPEISSSPAILGSLYNLGHNKIPHNNPKPNWFGVEVDYVYNLINEELSQLKEKGVGLI